MTFDKKTVKQAARGQWSHILTIADVDMQMIIKPQGCPDPQCPSKKDGFRCDRLQDDGGYYCNQCGAGDGFSLLMKVKGWSFPQALEFVAGVVGLSLDGKTLKTPAKREPLPAQPTYTPDDPNPTAVDQMNRIRAKATADDGTIDRYLVLRGLDTGAVSPKYIRLSHQFDPDSKKAYPCMICPIRTTDGYVVGYHRTYLDPDNGGKAQIDNPKRFTSALYDGAYRGCSVWLGRPDGKLIVCEGIETGLAVQQMNRGRAVWCPLSASMMKNVVLPSHVRVIEIWSDNDANQTGQRAAQVLHDRLKAEGRLVRIVTPPDTDTDWLDVLNQGKGAA